MCHNKICLKKLCDECQKINCLDNENSCIICSRCFNCYYKLYCLWKKSACTNKTCIDCSNLSPRGKLRFCNKYFKKNEQNT